MYLSYSYCLKCQPISSQLMRAPTFGRMKPQLKVYQDSKRCCRTTGLWNTVKMSIRHVNRMNILNARICKKNKIHTKPEKGGRKPAPSRNLFGSAKKCRGSARFCLASLHFCYFQQQGDLFKTHCLYIYIYDTTCLHVPFLSHVSLLCNPSPLLPRYHSSSPCKLSCSEPQRTLLSVEFQILSFSICLPLCS